MPRRESPDKGKRVVLQRLDDAAFDARGGAVEAWAVIATVEADSDRKAIEAVAGKPGTPEAKPGTYKSVPLSSWKGGLIYDQPSAPKVEVRNLDG